MFQHTQSGFTLAELLIVLTILAVITAFSIPKILISQQNQKFNAIAKEDIALVAAFYQKQQTDYPGDASIAPLDWQWTKYLNYTRFEFASNLDPAINQAAFDWYNYNESAYFLPNGSALIVPDIPENAFESESEPTHMQSCIQLFIDPDGRLSGQSDSLRIILFKNGRITSAAKMTSCENQWGTLQSSADPSWFNW